MVESAEFVCTRCGLEYNIGESKPTCSKGPCPMANKKEPIEPDYTARLSYWPYCEKCKSPFVFDPEEPFAYCECGATEWGNLRPADYVLDPNKFTNKCSNKGESLAFDYANALITEKLNNGK